MGTGRNVPSPVLVNIVLEDLGSVIRQDKKKGMCIGKNEIKLSLFTNGMTVYIENPRKST